MNIAFVIRTKIWGGVKTWMVEFGNELQKNGHQVYYFSNDPILTKEVQANGCVGHCLTFGSDYSPFTIRYFMRKFRQYQIEVSCMNIQKELRTAGIAAQFMKIPVIQRLGLPTDINFKLDQRFSQRFMVDEIIVTSLWMKREVAKRFSFIPDEKITCIYSAKAVTAAPKTSKADPMRFVITSRLADTKGHGSLIDAFRILADQGIENFSCDIFGNGPLKEEIESKIAEAGLGSKVILKGFSRKLHEKLGSYDCGILTSSREGLAHTVSEYLAAGLPCISTNGGALPELIEHEKNGLLFDYKDVPTLVNHLKTFLNMDEKRYTEYSRQASDTISRKFNLSKNARELERYFQACIDKKG
ncbi:MAG: glycosyltransferase [bacterium]